LGELAEESQVPPQIIRVSDVLDSQMVQFLFGSPHDLAEPGICLDEASVQINPRDAHDGLVEKSPESLFAFTQCHLGLPAVGDIDRTADKANGSPVALRTAMPRDMIQR
jgi:hypothetical protein